MQKSIYMETITAYQQIWLLISIILAKILYIAASAGLVHAPLNMSSVASLADSVNNYV